MPKTFYTLIYTQILVQTDIQSVSRQPLSKPYMLSVSQTSNQSDIESGIARHLLSKPATTQSAIHAVSQPDIRSSKHPVIQISSQL